MDSYYEGQLIKINDTRPRKFQTSKLQLTNSWGLDKFSSPKFYEVESTDCGLILKVYDKRTCDELRIDHGIYVLTSKGTQGWISSRYIKGVSK